MGRDLAISPEFRRGGLKLWPRGEATQHALQVIEGASRQAVDEITAETRVGQEALFNTMVRFENDMNQGMQRTYEELVLQMGIEMHRQAENSGFC